MLSDMQGWKDGWKDGQILFYRLLLATIGGTTKTFLKF